MKLPTTILLFIVCFGCNNGEEEALKKARQEELKPIHDTIYITSKIIEKDADLRNVPSYADPSKYTITHVNDRYYVTLPGGTSWDYYSTAAEAQQAINKQAKQSLETFIKSGGVDY